MQKYLKILLRKHVSLLRGYVNILYPFISGEICIFINRPIRYGLLCMPIHFQQFT